LEVGVEAVLRHRLKNEGLALVHLEVVEGEVEGEAEAEAEVTGVEEATGKDGIDLLERGDIKN
jgi:hypothetical protein